MHLPGCAPAMADGSFPLAGHLLRGPGGSTSRLHSIEAILGFTKDDGILGSFAAEPAAGAPKERDRRPGARAAGPRAPAGGAPPCAPPAPEFEGECAPGGPGEPRLRNAAGQRACLNLFLSGHPGAGLIAGASDLRSEQA